MSQLLSNPSEEVTIRISNSSCLYDTIKNIYIVGPHGIEGSCPTSPRVNRSLEDLQPKINKYISGIELCIKISKEEQVEEYYNFLDQYKNENENDKIEVVKQAPYYNTTQILKPEYEKEESTTLSNKRQLDQKIKKHFADLEQLGCEIQEFYIKYPSECKIKPEWYVVKKQFMYAYINIRCHHETKFYNQYIKPCINHSINFIL